MRRIQGPYLLLAQALCNDGVRAEKQGAHTHPEHLPQVGVPEPEGDVGDMESFGLLLLRGVRRMELLAVRLCCLVCLLQREDELKGCPPEIVWAHLSHPSPPPQPFPPRGQRSPREPGCTIPKVHMATRGHTFKPLLY